MKFRQKITIPTAIMIGLSLLLTTIITYSQVYKIIMQRLVENELPSTAGYIIEHIDKELLPVITASKIYAKSSVVRDWVTSGEPEENIEQIKKIMSVYKNITGCEISLVCASSRNYYKETGLSRTVGPDEGWFNNFISSNKDFHLNIDPSETDKSILNVFANNALRDTQGKSIGLVSLALNLNELSSFLSKMKPTPHSSLILLDKDGVIKSHPDLEIVTKKIKISELNNGNFNKNATLLNDPEKRNGVFSYKDSNGEIRVVAFNRSPETSWTSIVDIPRGELLSHLTKVTWMIFSIAILIIAGSIFGIGIIINRSTEGILKICAALKEIASGGADLTRKITVKSHDEIGELANSFNHFVDKLRSIIEQMANHSKTIASATETLSLSTVEISSTTEELSMQTNNIASAGEEAATNVTHIAQSAENMSSNIATVAIAIEEMNSSLSEVAKNCQMEAQAALNASDHAKQMQVHVENLGTVARDIGNVLEMINDVTDQINLLALNASIEAASAGDAGKGFAVVADEVKELAKQSANSTKTIEEQINSMQTATKESIASIVKISAIIEENTQISQSIMGAVEEQSSTIAEISKNMATTKLSADGITSNVSESSKGLNEISSNISHMHEAVKMNAKNITTTTKSISDLALLAEQLKDISSKFQI